jgi:hypothetical protein
MEPLCVREVKRDKHEATACRWNWGEHLLPFGREFLSVLWLWKGKKIKTYSLKFCPFVLYRCEIWYLKFRGKNMCWACPCFRAFRNCCGNGLQEESGSVHWAMLPSSGWLLNFYDWVDISISTLATHSWLLLSMTENVHDKRVIARVDGRMTLMWII